MMAEAVLLNPERLERWARSLLAAAGVPKSNAEEVARHLIVAEMSGVGSHGISRPSGAGKDCAGYPGGWDLA